MAKLSPSRSQLFKDNPTKFGIVDFCILFIAAGLNLFPSNSI